MSHQHLLGFSTTFVVRGQCEIDKSKSVPFRLEWTFGPSKSGYYGLRITMNDGVIIPDQTWELSLYTIGLQGRGFRVYVKRAAGAEFLRPDGQSYPSYGADEIEILGTGVKQVPGKPKRRPPDDRDIGTLRFTGPTIALEARSLRVRHVKESMTLSDHDTAPPPPEPGGEEGEGEE